MAHSIGKTIAELRKGKGWTQAQLAEKLSVTDKAISKWESEAGMPEISQLPALANLFGVSLDYLMTGKNAEPQIVTISKAELCAKNDDVSMLGNIDFYATDESGKSLFDYVVKYESINVFIAICETHNEITSFNYIDAIRMCLISNRLDLLKGESFVLQDKRARFTFENEAELLMLLPEDIKSHYPTPELKATCCLPESLFALIACDKRINEHTYSIVFGKQNNRKCVWYHAFPYIIHQAYLSNNTKMLDRLISLTLENNNFAFENYIYKTTHDSYYGTSSNYVLNYFFIAERQPGKGFGVVRILEETIKLALERNDLERIELFNSINIKIKDNYSAFMPYIAKEDQIKVAELRKSNASSEEIILHSLLKNGLIDVAGLLATKDSNLIKTGLKRFPITVLDWAYGLIQKNEWKTLFRFAIDNNFTNLAGIITGDRDMQSIFSFLYKNIFEFHYSQPSSRTDIRYELYSLNSAYLNLRNESGRGYVSCPTNSFEDAVTHIHKCKEQILKDQYLLDDKEETLKNLTKDYFLDELKKGNVEIVIIKLCVRLETIFKCDFHYDGDFSEMMVKYCNEHGSVDDGWGYMVDADFVSVFHKLRKCRNSIVHSEKSDEKMTTSELEFCINRICEMG